MAFIPYEHLEIQTSLALDEAVAGISKIVEPKKLFRNPFNRNHAAFQGEVRPDGFKISRIIHYRNSFLPTVNGRFEPSSVGTRVAVTMTLHPSVIAFGVLWFGMVGLFGGAFLLAALTARQFDPAMLIPVGMFVFGYLLFTLSFKWEARKARATLIELFTEQASPSTPLLNRLR